MKGKGDSQGRRGKESIEGEMDKEVGLETPPNENKEKHGEKSQEEPKKERKKKEEPGYTPEAREEEEEERLVFLPVSLELDNLKDWAVPGSEGDKGTLVEVNNKKVLEFKIYFAAGTFF